MIEIKKLKQLVQLMKDNDLTELDLRDADEQVTLRRGGGEVPPHAHASIPAPATHVPPPPQAQTASGAESAASEPSPKDQGLLEVPSPMVGTFYSAASPDTDPFVHVGARVDAESVVCIIEAMKVFNEIKAEVSGTIEKAPIANGQAVEYGEPLFLVKPD